MSTNALFRLVLEWLPFLLFLGLMLLVLARTGFGRKQSDYMAFMQKYCSDHLEETRKIGDALERIARAMEKSKSQT